MVLFFLLMLNTHTTRIFNILRVVFYVCGIGIESSLLRMSTRIAAQPTQLQVLSSTAIASLV